MRASWRRLVALLAHTENPHTGQKHLLNARSACLGHVQQKKASAALPTCDTLRHSKASRPPDSVKGGTGHMHFNADTVGPSRTQSSWHVQVQQEEMTWLLSAATELGR